MAVLLYKDENGEERKPRNAKEQRLAKEQLIQSKAHKNKFLKQHQEEVKDRQMNAPHTTIGASEQLRKINDKLYGLEDIKNFNMRDAIDSNPLSSKAGHVRSKLAYKFIMDNKNITAKYLLPGQICLFSYNDPKYKDDLEYFDKTPLVLFFGIFRTKDGNIREIGLNLHYFPPFTREKVLDKVYEIFKSYFEKCFNAPTHKPNNFISYKELQHLLKKDSKIAFATKEYIPTLRGITYVIPTKMLPTAFYTEGHFSKATIQQIMSFWRQFHS